MRVEIVNTVCLTNSVYEPVYLPENCTKWTG